MDFSFVQKNLIFLGIINAVLIRHQIKHLEFFLVVAVLTARDVSGIIAKSRPVHIRMTTVRISYQLNIKFCSLTSQILSIMIFVLCFKILDTCSAFFRWHVFRSLGHFNLLKPTGHVMHQQFNIQQLYVLPTLYLCV